MMTAVPAPATPRRGSGPQPNIKEGDSGTMITAPTSVTMAGTMTLPEPRSAAAKRLVSQIRTEPANTILA